MPRRTSAIALTLGLVVVALTPGRAALADPVEIAAELERLHDQYRFEVVGEDYLEDATGRSEGEDVVQRLRLLLERFDHIIVQTPGGGVERVIILGRTTPAPRPPVVAVAPPADVDAPPPVDGEVIVVPRRLDGNRGWVSVTLLGTKGQSVPQELLLDTGADLVVLPASMAARLGLDLATLEKREVHTASGETTEARTARLPGIMLGTHRVNDVDVAFLDDGKNPVTGLLGNNVLGRYKMNNDPTAREITLTPVH